MHELRPPLAPPRLTKEQAIEIGKRGYAESLFDHPYILDYGSSYFAKRIGDRFVGMVDVWAITIRDLSIARPGGRSGRPVRPKPVTTLVIYVDDKNGTVLHAEGY